MGSITDAVNAAKVAEAAAKEKAEKEKQLELKNRKEYEEKYQVVYRDIILPAFESVIVDLKGANDNSSGEIIGPPKIEHKIGLDSKNVPDALVIKMNQKYYDELVACASPMIGLNVIHFRINFIWLPSKTTYYSDFHIDKANKDAIIKAITDQYMDIRKRRE